VTPALLDLMRDDDSGAMNAEPNEHGKNEVDDDRYFEYRY
jgi:hypothetical protein